MWYESYGWKNNPFLIKPNPEIVNFEIEKEKLVNYVTSGDICFLIGEPGTGKTSLLKWLEYNLKKHFLVYINIENLDHEFSIKDFFNKHTKLSRKILGLNYPKNTVFLLDESKKIEEKLRNAIKMHFDENHIKSIVFVQSVEEPDVPDSLKNRVGNRIIKINKLNEANAFQLVKNKCGKICPFSEGAINLIIEKSNYLPRKILENCENICINLKGKKEITINDVQNILKIKQEDKSIKNYLLSPMEENIIKIINESNKTAQELAELLQTTEGSVGKQLSKLTQKNLIKIISHKRPKLYGLNK